MTIEQFPVTNRWTGEVQFTAEIEVTADMTPSVKLGLAVGWGAKNKANLAGANLARANLADAYLAGANLARANLADAYLAGAYLGGANLADAYLTGAYLADAYLARAYLAGANLGGANLGGANLGGAYLTGAYLADAYLAGAEWREGVPLTRAPMQLYGLDYPVTILDAHMQIGCECHSLAQWEGFENDRIAAMDGKRALKFWAAHRDTLLGMARADGRVFGMEAA